MLNHLDAAQYTPRLLVGSCESFDTTNGGMHLHKLNLYELEENAIYLFLSGQQNSGGHDSSDAGIVLIVPSCTVFVPAWLLARGKSYSNDANQAWSACDMFWQNQPHL